MATTQHRRQNIERLRNPPSISVPAIGTKVNLPDRSGLAWYAGLGAMAAVELIEWPIALLVAGTHFIEHHAHSRDIQELADGIDAGA
jgi:hypothetical protein